MPASLAPPPSMACEPASQGVHRAAWKVASMKTSSLLTLMVVLFAAAGCASRAADNDGYSRLYEQGLRERAGATRVSDAAVERFVALYSPIDADYIDAPC